MKNNYYNRFSKKIKLKNFKLIVFLFLIFISFNSFATTNTWQGGSGTTLNWQTVGNWTAGHAPQAGEDVVFNTAGTLTFTTGCAASVALNSLTISQGTVTLIGAAAYILTLGGNAGTDFTISSGASLILSTNLSITMAASSTADISGAFTINAGRTWTVTSATTCTVSSTGSISNAGTITGATSSILIFQSSSSYTHNQNGGTIPTSNWNSGSTCVVKGTSIPAGISQTFANLNLNTTVSSVGVNSNITTTGDLTISSGTKMSVSRSGSAYTWNIGGSFYLTAAASTFYVCDNNNSNNIINITKDFIMSGGAIFDFCNSNAAGGTSQTMTIGGNFTHTAGAFQNSDASSGTATITFNGTGTQILESIGESGTNHFTFIANQSGASATIQVATSKTFTLSAGSTFEVKNNASNNLELDIFGNFITSAGAFKNDASATITIENGGKLQANVSITNNGAFIVNGTYEHHCDGGTIPTATWDIASTCLVSETNTDTKVQGITGQTFGNFTWDRGGDGAADIDENMTGNITILGNFYLKTAPPSGYDMTWFTTGSFNMTIGGNFTFDNGLFWLQDGGGAAETNILNVGGSYTQGAGATFNYDHAGTTSMLAFNFTGTGTFTQSGTLTNTYINWNVNSGAVLTLSSDLPVAASRTATITGTLICGTAASQKNVIGGGAFVLANASTAEIRITNSTAGITAAGTATGNVLTTGGRTFNTGANYYYMGNAAQITGTGLPTSCNNLTIANSGDFAVTLSNNITVNGTCYMTRGTLSLGGKTLSYGATGTLCYNSITAAQTTAASEFPAASGPYNLTINNSSGVTLLASANRTINGTITMTSGTLNLNGITLTLGTASGSISGETNTNRIFGTTGEISKTMNCSVNSTAYTFGNIGMKITTRASGNVPGNTTILRGHAVQSSNGNNSIFRYYTVTPTTNTALSAQIDFYYFDAELNGQTSDANMKLWYAPSPYSAYTLQTSNWSDNGSNDYITGTTIDVVGYRWTVSNNSTNALPISLSSFVANLNNEKVYLNWTTVSETNNNYFTIERSANAEFFEDITRVLGAGNSISTLTYNSIDTSPLKGISYYRLKQIDFDGKSTYSKIVTINNVKNNLFNAFVNPNGNRDVNINFNLIENAKVSVKVYDTQGNLVQSMFDNSSFEAGFHEYKIKINNSGLYIVRASINDKFFVHKVIVK